MGSMEKVLEQILSELKEVKQGQAQLFEGQTRLEEGQKQLEAGQKQLETGQKQLEVQVSLNTAKIDRMDRELLFATHEIKGIKSELVHVNRKLDRLLDETDLTSRYLQQEMQKKPQ